MRAIIVVVLMLFLQPAVAASVDNKPIDGHWLKNGVDAFDRALAAGNGSEEDLARSSTLVGYIFGMLAVHRQNNTTFDVLTGVIRKHHPLTREDQLEINVGKAFVPLMSVPDNLSSEQAVAITRKFLDRNPTRLNEPAEALLTDAFQAEFPAPTTK